MYFVGSRQQQMPPSIVVESHAG